MTECQQFEKADFCDILIRIPINKKMVYLLFNVSTRFLG